MSQPSMLDLDHFECHCQPVDFVQIFTHFPVSPEFQDESTALILEKMLMCLKKHSSESEGKIRAGDNVHICAPRSNGSGFNATRWAFGQARPPRHIPAK